MEQFDTVVKQHIGLIQSGGSHTAYLGNIIQNELIEYIGKIIMETMANKIKEAKYFSLIVDSTPEINHIEQVSLTIRTVAVHSVAVKEHCMWFLESEGSTGRKPVIPHYKETAGAQHLF